MKQLNPPTLITPKSPYSHGLFIGKQYLMFPLFIACYIRRFWEFLADFDPCSLGVIIECPLQVMKGERGKVGQHFIVFCVIGVAKSPVRVWNGNFGKS